MPRFLTAGTMALLLTACWIATAAPAGAAGYGTDERGRLFEVLPGKKASRYLGTVRVTNGTRAYTPQLTDIALSPKHGMYGISFDTLYRIDMTDPGRSKRVGSLGVTLNALAFAPDDTLWAAGGSSLHRVDRLTGRATRVGSFGTAGYSDGDLAFVDKTLYATLGGMGGSRLVTLDTKTGKATPVGVVRAAGGRAVHSVWGLIWDGQRLHALTHEGRVLHIDPKSALASSSFQVRNRFYGACPRIRL